eukprot:378582-Prymnesium_polylepis.1
MQRGVSLSLFAHKVLCHERVSMYGMRRVEAYAHALGKGAEGTKLHVCGELVVYHDAHFYDICLKKF